MQARGPRLSRQSVRGIDRNIGIGGIMDNTYLARDKYGIYTSSERLEPGPALMGADTLLGNDVYNLQGEKLGDIKEFMIHMATGRIAYAVLSFGGILGMGDKLSRCRGPH